MKEFHPEEESKDDSTEIDNKKRDKEDYQIEIQDNTPIDLNLQRNYGNSYAFLFIKNEPLIVIGPDWKYFALIYPIAVLIFALQYSLKIKPKMHLAYQIISVAVFVFFTFSYVIVAFKNQGIPPIPTNKSPEELKNYRQCSICHCIINLDSEYITYHCAVCDICVENFNHHCPYATKCIANGNSLYFHIFLISIPILIIGEIAMIFL